MDTDHDRESLLERLNRALRLAEDFGGLQRWCASSIDSRRSNRAAGPTCGFPTRTRAWLRQRCLRQGFPDADVHVVASGYGEDAHRRGWLRLDRTLTPAEHSAVVDTATSSLRNNRSPCRLWSGVEQRSNLFGVFPVHQRCEAPRADPVLSDSAVRRPGSWDWSSTKFNETH